MSFTQQQMLDFLNQSLEDRLNHIEQLNRDWKLREQYEKNIYKHPLFMLIQVDNNDEAYAKGNAKKRATFYRCKEHTTWWNINFQMLIDHLLQDQHIEKHKEFINNEFYESQKDDREQQHTKSGGRKRYRP